MPVSRFNALTPLPRSLHLSNVGSTTQRLPIFQDPLAGKHYKAGLLKSDEVLTTLVDRLVPADGQMPLSISVTLDEEQYPLEFDGLPSVTNLGPSPSRAEKIKCGEQLLHLIAERLVQIFARQETLSPDQARHAAFTVAGLLGNTDVWNYEKNLLEETLRRRNITLPPPCVEGINLVCMGGAILAHKVIGFDAYYTNKSHTRSSQQGLILSYETGTLFRADGDDLCASPIYTAFSSEDLALHRAAQHRPSLGFFARFLEFFSRILPGIKIRTDTGGLKANGYRCDESVISSMRPKFMQESRSIDYSDAQPSGVACLHSANKTVYSYAEEAETVIAHQKPLYFQEVCSSRRGFNENFILSEILATGVGEATMQLINKSIAMKVSYAKERDTFESQVGRDFKRSFASTVPFCAINGIGIFAGDELQVLHDKACEWARSTDPRRRKQNEFELIQLAAAKNIDFDPADDFSVILPCIADHLFNRFTHLIERNISDDNVRKGVYCAIAQDAILAIVGPVSSNEIKDIFYSGAPLYCSSNILCDSNGGAVTVDVKHGKNVRFSVPTVGDDVTRFDQARSRLHYSGTFTIGHGDDNAIKLTCTKAQYSGRLYKDALP